MLLRLLSAIFALAMLTSPTSAQEREGEYLYKVSTIRAAPGALSDLLNWIEALKGSDYFKDSGEHAPFIMRHSQGDQWDLLLISPMNNWTNYHSNAATRKRDKAVLKHAQLLAPVDQLIAFDEDHFAFGPPVSEIESEYRSNNFYHIEMFHAAPGKSEDLLEQRRMENAYLTTTGQTTNMIFRRAAGSDVDVFTIGFHKNLQAFAEPSSATAEESEAAAINAGFKDRADISFYLRSLISAHHDTLAVKVE